jgi:hypothetical protein
MSLNPLCHCGNEMLESDDCCENCKERGNPRKNAQAAASLAVDVVVHLNEKIDASRKALVALVAQVRRAGRGLHTDSCATLPQEIPQRPMDIGPDGYEPTYTKPSACDCGAVKTAALVNEALALTESHWPTI